MSKLLKIAFITLIACIALLSVGHLLLEYSSLEQGLQTITTHYWHFALFRYVIYGLIVFFWPPIVKKIGLKRHWPEDIIQLFSRQRLKLLSLFILIEIFFVYNLIGHMVVWL
ncbi:MAG: hypothetical protein K5Q00_03020 [Gammaproteobacteria bacterium]|nr:hypothetical protein [Gammaproteobacteria bacterium]